METVLCPTDNYCEYFVFVVLIFAIELYQKKFIPKEVYFNNCAQFGQKQFFKKCLSNLKKIST